MPQQRRIISDVSPQFAGLSIGAAEAPGLAAARLGDTIATIGDQYLEKQKQLQQSRELMAAQGTAADAAQSFYDTTIHDPNIDPKDLTSSVQTGLKKIGDQQAKQIKDPEVRIRFQEGFQSLFESHSASARIEQFKKQKDSYIAELNGQVSNLASLSATADEHTVDVYKAKMTSLYTNAVAIGYMSKVEAQDALENGFGQIEHAQVLQRTQTNDPQEAQQVATDIRLGRYPHIPAVMQVNLAEQADKRSETLKQGQLALVLAQDAAADKKKKVEADQALAVYENAAENGTLNVADLQRDGVTYAGYWPTGRQSAIYDRFINKKEFASDEMAKADINSRINDEPPSITRDELSKHLRNSKNPNGDLNTADYMAADNKLTETLHRLDHETPGRRKATADAFAEGKTKFGGTDKWEQYQYQFHRAIRDNPNADPFDINGAIFKQIGTAVNLNAYQSAKDKLNKARYAIGNIQFTHPIMSEIRTNPKYQPYKDARDEFLKQAEKYGKIAGNTDLADFDVRKPKTGPYAGKTLIPLDGKVVIE